MTTKDIIKLLPAKYDLERKIGMVSGITIGQAEMIATLVLDDITSALSKIDDPTKCTHCGFEMKFHECNPHSKTPSKITDEIPQQCHSCMRYDQMNDCFYNQMGDRYERK